MTHPLTVRHKLVGAMLRRYREGAGYNLETAAAIIGCDRSKISRVETGQRGMRPAELRALLTEYGVETPAQQPLVTLARPRAVGGWTHDDRGILGSDYLDFTVAEAAASHILVYAPLQVPELLRTKEYAKAIAAADPVIPGDSEYLAVRAVTVRQAAVFKKQHTGCTVILGEAALKQQAGGPGVLREQLAFLARLGSAHPGLSIRILPFEAGAHAAGGFSVLQFKETPGLGLAHLVGPGGGVCLDDTAAVNGYVKTFTHLSCFSISPEQSAEKFRQLAGPRPAA